MRFHYWLMVPLFLAGLIRLSVLQPLSLEADSKEKQSGGKAQKTSDCDFSKYKPVIVSDVFTPKTKTKDALPDYPLIALQARIQGEVRVKVLIRNDGQVVKACVIEGHPFLRQASVKAALQVKFLPWCPSCKKEGFAQEVFTYHFSIDGSENSTKNTNVTRN